MDPSEENKRKKNIPIGNDNHEDTKREREKCAMTPGLVA
jgi:hypothetical protein